MVYNGRNQLKGLLGRGFSVTIYLSVRTLFDESMSCSVPIAGVCRDRLPLGIIDHECCTTTLFEWIFYCDHRLSAGRVASLGVWEVCW